MKSVVTERKKGILLIKFLVLIIYSVIFFTQAIEIDLRQYLVVLAIILFGIITSSWDLYNDIKSKKDIENNNN